MACCRCSRYGSKSVVLIESDGHAFRLGSKDSSGDTVTNLLMAANRFLQPIEGEDEADSDFRANGQGLGGMEERPA